MFWVSVLHLDTHLVMTHPIQRSNSLKARLINTSMKHNHGDNDIIKAGMKISADLDITELAPMIFVLQVSEIMVIIFKWLFVLFHIISQSLGTH